MIIVPKNTDEAKYHMTNNTYVEARLLRDINRHQGNQYAPIKLIVDRFKIYEHCGEPVFESRSQKDLGEVVLSGSGITKARKRVEKRLRELGIFNPEVPIIFVRESLK